VVSIAYLDTSALIKRYITEVGSEWIRTLLGESATRTFTSLLTVIEGTCTLARRRREGRLSPDDHRRVLETFDYDLKYRYAILEVEPRTIDAARQLADRNPLRAYDAVQLATAWLLNQDLLDSSQPPLTFICADDRLLDIAQSEGLLAANPNRHP
jgi:predicted nucleic acid-binding protein